MIDHQPHPDAVQWFEDFYEHRAEHVHEGIGTRRGQIAFGDQSVTLTGIARSRCQVRPIVQAEHHQRLAVRGQRRVYIDVRVVGLTAPGCDHQQKRRAEAQHV